MDIYTFFEQNQLAFYGVRAVLLAAGLLALAVALGRWRRSGARDMQRLLAELDQSRGDARELYVLAERLARRVEELTDRIEDRSELVFASAGSSQRGYELALQMARNGASHDEIVSASGVTRHEASLLSRLHNPALR